MNQVRIGNTQGAIQAIDNANACIQQYIPARERTLIYHRFSGVFREEQDSDRLYDDLGRFIDGQLENA